MLLELEDDFDVLGTAMDYDGLVAGAESTAPQVVVTDIRMPPAFGRRASTPPRRSASGTPAPASSS